ncbi:uncharacterized protein [Dysidea avara]
MSRMGVKALIDLQLKDVVDLGIEMGRGAYGAVKEVSVHGYGIPCAAKVVHEILLSHVSKEEYERLKKMFTQECVHTSKLRHPNLVQFLGVYYPNEQTDFPWLIMEKLHTSLTGLLERYTREQISSTTKMSIMQDITLGIQYLHSHEIIHRDLSSNNVILTKNLVAKLADFGVAKMIDPQTARTHTQVPGTMIFMPPEALSVNPRYGKPVDVFSFGCVMVHMISHQWPIPDDQVTKTLRALTEIERRKKYLREMKVPSSVMTLLGSCLKNAPEQRPAIGEVLDTLRNICVQQSWCAFDNIIEFEEMLKIQNIDIFEQKPVQKVLKVCPASKCSRLMIRLTEEKTLQPSESLTQVLENMKLPGSGLIDGSHFLYYLDNKLFVLSDLKKWYNMMGRYVLVLDMQSGTIDYLDTQVRRFCPFEDGFLSLELDPKSPGTTFNTLDTSGCKWVRSSIPPLLNRDAKFPVFLAYSTLLLAFSGNHVQVLELNTRRWHLFVFSTPSGPLEPALSTNYAILGDQLFLCYAEITELYCADMQQIIDAVMAEAQPTSDLTICFTRVLRPVNCIFVHKDVLVALYIKQDGSMQCIDRAWYHRSQCDHWHNITPCYPYIDGQWFMMENGKAAVAELSASWSYVWRSWCITAKIHEIQLEAE